MKNVYSYFSNLDCPNCDEPLSKYVKSGSYESPGFNIECVCNFSVYSTSSFYDDNFAIQVNDPKIIFFLDGTPGYSRTARVYSGKYFELIKFVKFNSDDQAKQYLFNFHINYPKYISLLTLL